jgi:hypothetical protein
MRILPLFVLKNTIRVLLVIAVVGVELFGCQEETPWQHQLGKGEHQFREDSAECRIYAREIAREQRGSVKVPSAALHGGVQETFLIFALYQEAYETCMEVKGWYRNR